MNTPDIKVKNREGVRRVIGEGTCSKTLLSLHPEDGGDSAFLNIEFHGNLPPAAVEKEDNEEGYSGKVLLQIHGANEISEFLHTMKHFLVEEGG